MPYFYMANDMEWSGSNVWITGGDASLRVPPKYLSICRAIYRPVDAFVMIDLRRLMQCATIAAS